MDALTTAALAVVQPGSLLMLVCGVGLGLILGAIPGVGSVFGLALAVPLTYGMDPYAAIALMLGLASVTTTSDTIPAVMLGVPGTVGAITTVEDGHPLAQQHQAARALGAAYSASMIGGLIGAALLALSIPILRPLVMTLTSPDLLAISVAGLLFVSSVSGPDPLKGIVAMLVGIMLSFVGLDAQTGTERYTGGFLLLWDGIPAATAMLGLFGFAELTNLLRRESIARADHGLTGSTQLQGIRDTLREWRLVLQCSATGSLVGAVPGVGVMVIDWIAYGIAKRDRRGGPPFGTGNIRGVIAPESANNAKEGGYLVPTLALGLPGSITMVFLLAVFTIHGIVPGPDMLRNELPLIYSMVFTIATANVLGAGVCLALTGQLARLASVPSSIIVVVALVFVVLGSFQEHMSIGDIITLVLFGLLGMYMKAHDWPRAALTLGFVLGPNIERYFHISSQIEGMGWISRPSVIVVLLLLAFVVYRSRSAWAAAFIKAEPKPHRGQDLSAALCLAVAAVAGWTNAAGLPAEAAMFPQIMATALLAATAILALRSLRAARPADAPILSPEMKRFPVAAAQIMALCAALVGLLYTVGHVTAALIFVGGSLLVFNWNKKPRALAIGCSTALAAYLVFDVLVARSWPPPLLNPLLSAAGLPVRL